MALSEVGIPYRIVPGITAGIAGPAYAGIPITHRTINHSVTFLTGHDADGGIPKTFDWNAIANASPVLVFYMAMKHITEIAAHLISAGRSAEEPVVFITHATTANQTVHETILAKVGDYLNSHHIEPPAIVVIGQAVSLRHQLQWLPIEMM